jgi:hypothetical protein
VHYDENANKAQVEGPSSTSFRKKTIDAINMVIFMDCDIRKGILPMLINFNSDELSFEFVFFFQILNEEIAYCLYNDFVTTYIGNFPLLGECDIVVNSS